METLVNRAGFWSGKRVLVTGHTGFKGAWLSLWLQRLGAVVAGYSLAPPTSPNLFESAKLEQGMRSELADVTDAGRLAKGFQDVKPEIVFHLAAQSLVRDGYARPVDTYATNVMGTVNVLEACRASASVRSCVIVTTDKCYENREWVWGYRENDPMGGRDPYSSSKGCAELVATAYRESYFSSASSPQLATARAGNVIGGGDWATDRLVPDLLRAFVDGKSAPIRNPTAVRPWQHVLEPLNGYLLLAQRLWSTPGRFTGGWNFGPDDADSREVAWIADRLVGLWGNSAAWHHDKAQHPHEAGMLKLDCSKARALLPWRPALELSQALEWIVEWHQAHRAGRDMRAFSLDQIDRFEKILSEPS